MLNKIKGLVKEEQGQGMTEYGLLLAVVVAVLVLCLTVFKGTIKKLFDDINTAISGAVSKATS